MRSIENVAFIDTLFHIARLLDRLHLAELNGRHTKRAVNRTMTIHDLFFSVRLQRFLGQPSKQGLRIVRPEKGKNMTNMIIGANRRLRFNVLRCRRYTIRNTNPRLGSLLFFLKKRKVAAAREREQQRQRQ